MRRRTIVVMSVVILATIAGAIALARRSASESRPTDASLLRNLGDEYDNGGLFQFFWNTRGKNNDLTLMALERLNDRRYADVFRKAVAEFNAEWSQMAAAWGSFDKTMDVATYSAAVAQSAIPALDREWAALPPISP